MIIEVTETIYKGILIERVKDEGWKCNLGGTEYLFPNYTAAQAAIDEIFDGIKPVIKKNKGVKQERPSESQQLIPLCENCERLANISTAFQEHLKLEDKYLNTLLAILEEQKDAFQDKDYQYAEKVLDELIAELKIE